MDVERIVIKAVMFLPPMILSLSVHEYAHARVAYALGDDTAARRGRMTLNPLSHIDLIGTILLPLLSITSGFAFFGWAKPVPVAPWRFSKRFSMHAAHSMVAVAGPLSNILLAVIASILLHAMNINLESVGSIGIAASYFIQVTFFMNVALAIFNMLPLVPLDGSRLLPPAIQQKMQRYTFLVFIGFILILNRAPQILFVPIELIAKGIYWLTGLPFA